MCGTVSVEASREQQPGCCLATELGIDCERTGFCSNGRRRYVINCRAVNWNIKWRCICVSLVQRVATIRNYQAFSDMSLLFPLCGVVKYIFLFILYDLYICLFSNSRICLAVLIYYKDIGISNILSFINKDQLNMCCLKFNCTIYKTSGLTTQNRFSVQYKD